MQPTRLLLCLAIAAGIPAGVAAAAPAPANAAPPALAVPDEAHQTELITYAQGMIAKGNPQQAIDAYLDKVIAHYETATASEKRTIYSARTPTESLYYAVVAASEKKSTVVVGPNWSDALFYKSFALVDLGRHAEAQVVLERLIAMTPQNARNLSELGNLHQQAKRWEMALATFRRVEAAAEFSPDGLKIVETTRGLRGQGFSLTELGRLDESEAVYRKCLLLDPRDKIAAGELRYIAGLRAKAGSNVPVT